MGFLAEKALKLMMGELQISNARNEKSDILNVPGSECATVVEKDLRKIKAKLHILSELNNRQARSSTVQTSRCFCCESSRLWRKKNNRDGRWICEVCHPPGLSKDEIEWLQ